MARINISDGTVQKSVELNDVISICGRSPDNKIPIEDKQASRKHCQIERTELGYKVVDLESRNGTRVNDRQVNQALLRPGDKIQIGKHVLTFEDPAWKEPPADVVARLAVPEPAPTGFPKAVEVHRPAPPPAGAEVRSTRRTSGNTTAIHKIARTEMRKEQHTLTLVAVGAGIFLFILIALVAFSGGGPEPKAQKTAQDLIFQARQLMSVQRYDDALAALAKVDSGQPALHGQAQGLIKQIEALQAAKTAVPASEAERKDFDELYDFAEKNRTKPQTYERLATMCEEFRKKYPKSVVASKVDEYLRLAVDGRKAARRAELAESEKSAQEDLKRQDFASALKRIKTLLTRYNDEPEIRERLVKLQDDVTDKARTFFQVKRAEAESLKSTNKDEARSIYQALIGSLGTGSVPEFEDYCKIAKNLLEAIQ